jgi:hypothetical protein
VLSVCCWLLASSFVCCSAKVFEGFPAPASPE